MRVVIYALGGAYGHPLRAMGLARALQDRRTHCTVLAAESSKDWARLARVPVASPPSGVWRDSGLLANWVTGAVRDARPDVLVMDLFPLGAQAELRGRLTALAPCRVLLTRRVPARYYLRADVAAELRGFDAQLWTETPPDELRTLLAECRDVQTVPPVLLVRPAEVETATSGRQFFGVSELERVVLGLGSGDAATERHLLHTLAEAARHARCGVLFFARDIEPQESRTLRVVRASPGGAWLRACPLVVAAAGYQSVYEILQADVPAILLPQPRVGDDQAWRAADACARAPDRIAVPDTSQLADTIAPWLNALLQARRAQGGLAEGVETRRATPAGAAAAADALLRVLAGR